MLFCGEQRPPHLKVLLVVMLFYVQNFLMPAAASSIGVHSYPFLGLLISLSHGQHAGQLQLIAAATGLHRCGYITIHDTVGTPRPQQVLQAFGDAMARFEPELIAARADRAANESSQVCC